MSDASTKQPAPESHKEVKLESHNQAKVVGVGLQLEMMHCTSGQSLKVVIVYIVPGFAAEACDQICVDDTVLCIDGVKVCAYHGQTL